jgi:D-beta-D-heptose 7-phosphate kinase/D-beta-D-heptose 1-phosphate adenosyltransferase
VTLVVVGDVLLDRDLDGRADRLCPEAPVPVVDEPEATARPGGAGLAAALAAEDGEDVVLVTALARDDRARELRRLLHRFGIEIVDLGLEGPTPEKVRVRADGRLLVRMDSGASGTVGRPTQRADAAICSSAGILVSDYGRGVAGRCARSLAAAAARAPLVWDPHPRGREPVRRTRLATPNRSEAGAATPERARELLRDWGVRAVAITLGREGAVLVEETGSPLVVPAPRVPDGDTCGAGDRFASAAAGLLARGALAAEAVEGAVHAASAFVAAGGAGALGRMAAERFVVEDAAALVARVRAGGGTVVAAGGCFDILHAGHVALLEAARSLGDCLVVLLNSDESVRRVKGPDRPLVPEDDRAAVLTALAAVDEVVVFDEDTPVEALKRLRPDVFVKGGDYGLEALPETAVLEGWGGRAVILPYVAGRSTTRLIEDAQARA